MLKLENINKSIQANNYPYWKLQMKSHPNAKPVSIANYNLENISDDLSDEEKQDKSIEFLKSQVDNYKDIPGVIFVVTLKLSATSSGAGVIGPLEFGVNENNQQLGNLPGPQQYTDPTQFGYTSNFNLGQIMDVMDRKAEVRVKESLFVEKERALAEKEKALNEKIKEKEKSLEGLEKKYNSESEKVSKGALKAMYKLYDIWIDDDDESPGKTKKKESGKGDNDKKKEEAVEDVANYINDNLKSCDDVKGLGNVIKKMIENKSKSKDGKENVSEEEQEKDKD